MSTFPRNAWFALVVLAVGAAAWYSRAGETLKPGRLSKAEQAALQSGLTLRVYRKDTLLDARRVRLAALYVEDGTAPTPFVEAGPFAAKLNGYLKTSLKGEFSFRIACTGKAACGLTARTC